MEYPKFKVCCRCFTFNQAKYITDTMNGFTMQQTSFQFVCTIVDDASTDGEQEVIRKYVEDNFDFSEGSAAFNKETDYAHITYAQHKINKNCYFAVLYLKENHYSQRKPKMGYLNEWRDMCEYEELCEGDDCWTNPKKIQMQVDVLDNDSNVKLVYTGFECIDDSNHKCVVDHLEWYMKEWSRSGDILSDLLKKSFILTCTICFRKEITLSKIYQESPRSLDYLIFLTAASLGDVVYIPERMSYYRINPNGMMHTKFDLVVKIALEIRRYFMLVILSKNTKVISCVEYKKILNTIAGESVSLIREGKTALLFQYVKSEPVLFWFILSAIINHIKYKINDKLFI